MCSTNTILYTNRETRKKQEKARLAMWKVCLIFLKQGLQILKVSWSLSFSSFHRVSVWLRSGDWLVYSSSLIFCLQNQLTVSLNLFLGEMFTVHGFIFIILVGGSRFFYQECLNTFSIQLYKACQCHMLKNSPTAWCSHLQTSLGDMECLLISKHGVASKEFSFGLTWSDFILPAFHRLV